MQKLREIKGYAPLFAAAFGDSTITFERIAKALATFERTIVSGNSAYDRYLAGDKSALTKQQKNGLNFFNKKGECAECHSGPNFTTEKFANLGIGMDRGPPRPWLGGGDEESGAIWENSKYQACAILAHRRPTCTTAAFKTLSEVLEMYAKGGLPNPHLDTRLTPFYHGRANEAGSAGIPRFAQWGRLAENHSAGRPP